MCGGGHPLCLCGSLIRKESELLDFYPSHDIRIDQECLKLSLKALTLQCGGQYRLLTSLCSTRREEWNLLGHWHSRHSSRLPNPNTAFSASPDPKPGFGASCLKPEGVSYNWLAGGPQSVLWDPGASPVSRRVRCYLKCLGQRNSLGKEVSPMTWLAARWAGDEGGSQILRHPRRGYLPLASRTKCTNTYMCCTCMSAHISTGGMGFVTHSLKPERREEAYYRAASPRLRGCWSQWLLPTSSPLTRKINK